ncbi:MAG TPA: hypothetical protein VE010_20870 [Thermoanaerobaculia bacterium]|nr:hypothetical protein [Thermoanaerobaculia bacterium]
MILVLFRIHAVAAGLVFLVLAVNAASSRSKRAWFWLAVASAYGCAVAMTFAHVAGVVAGAVILATSVAVHMTVQGRTSAPSRDHRTLRKWTRITRTGSSRSSGDRTASRRAARGRSAREDRFSNTG